MAVDAAPNRVADHRLPGDEAIVRGCLEGRREAWNELVDRYGRLVRSVCRRRGLSDADADDVLQEVLAIVLGKLHTVRDASRLRSWLIRVAHRETGRVARRGARFVVLDRDLEARAAPPAEEAAARERRHRVREALPRLGRSGAELVVALFSSDGRPSYRRIAEGLGVKVGSIGPTRARCFRRLERLLAE